MTEITKNPDKHTFREFFRFWQLVFIKVRFNLRSEATQSYLSYAWWVLEPLMQMGVYYIVFDILLNRGGKDFVPFLLCGIVPWLWFAKSVANSSRSIVQGQGLIGQTYLPKPFFPLVVIGQDLLKQQVVFLLLFSFLFYFGYFPNVNWFWLIPIVITQLLLIIAISFLVSFVVPFARDLQYLINAVLMMTMFGSGIFYSYENVFLPEHREIFLMNPMANLIVSYRMVLMEGGAPMTGSLVVIAVVSLAFIFLMSQAMKRYNNTLTRLALE
jgi:lipopolysaccharide transport system permease protein